MADIILDMSETAGNDSASGWLEYSAYDSSFSVNSSNTNSNSDNWDEVYSANLASSLKYRYQDDTIYVGSKIQHVNFPVRKRNYIRRAYLRFEGSSDTSGVDTASKVLYLKLRPKSAISNLTLQVFRFDVPSAFTWGTTTATSLKKEFYDKQNSTTAYSDAYTIVAAATADEILVPLNSTAFTALSNTSNGGQYGLCLRGYTYDVLNNDPGVDETATPPAILNITNLLVSYEMAFYSGKNASAYSPQLVIKSEGFAGFPHKILGIDGSDIAQLDDIAVDNIGEINNIQ
tara:strand:+ start:146 stop:1009 length:864 start_codon:yes stop_codon:yes gene_type:complete